MGKYSVGNSQGTIVVSNGGGGGNTTIEKTIYKIIPSRDRGIIYPDTELTDLRAGDYWSLGEDGTYPQLLDGNGNQIIGTFNSLVTYITDTEGELAYFKYTFRNKPFGDIDDSSDNVTLAAKDIKQYVSDEINAKSFGIRLRGPAHPFSTPVDPRDGDYWIPSAGGIFNDFGGVEVESDEIGFQQRINYSSTYPNNFFLSKIPINHDLIVAFPFVQGPTVKNFPGLENFIKKCEIRFDTEAHEKRITLKRIWVNAASAYGLQLIDTENPSTVLCQLYAQNYTMPANGIDNLTLEPYQNSGVRGFVRVDWNAFDTEGTKNPYIEISPEHFTFQNHIDAEGIEAPYSNENVYVNPEFKAIQAVPISFKEESDFYDSNGLRKFYAKQIKRNVNGYTVLQIAEGNTIVAQYVYNGLASGIETIKIPPYQNSGVYVTVRINWDNVTAGVTHSGTYYLQPDFHVHNDANAEYPACFEPFTEERENLGSSPMPVAFIPHATKDLYPDLTLREILNAIYIKVEGFIGKTPPITVSKIARNHSAYGYMLELQYFENNSWKPFMRFNNIDITESIYKTESYKTVELLADNAEGQTYWERLKVTFRVNWRTLPEGAILDLTQNENGDGAEIYHEIRETHLIQMELDDILKRDYYAFS